MSINIIFMDNTVLEKFKKVRRNFLSSPVSFLVRQLYRVFFIFPFEIITSMIFLITPHKKISGKEPSSFCFLITSVIYSKTAKTVSYGSARSVFTPEERAEQTLRTIESVRQKVPGARVVLIEAGLQENLPYNLAQKADKYIYLGNKKIVRWACDSTFKSLGESFMLLYAVKYTGDYDFYFKISGRYFLDENFDINAWKQGQFVLYFRPDLDEYISTRLYGFRKEMKKEWKYALIKGLPFSLIGYAIENTLAKFIPKKYVYRISKMGVTGIGASLNDIMKE